VFGTPDPVFESGQEWWSYPLASALSRILVGGSAWMGHWWYANRLWADVSERGAIERPASMRFVYFVAVLIVAAAASIGFLGQGLGAVLDALLGTVDDGGMVAELIAALLAAALFALAWWLNGGWLRSAAAEPAGPDAAAGERLVAYPTAIVGLAFAAVGIGRLLGQLIEALFGGGEVVIGGQVALEIVADFVPVGLLGIGVWLWQWSRVTRARRTDPAGEGASTVRRASLLIVLAVSVLSGVAALGAILYQLFGTLFGIDAQGDPWVPLGALITALAVAAYHGQLLRQDAAVRGPVAAHPSAEGPSPADQPQLGLRLVAPPGTDPAELVRMRRALEAQLPDGYRLDDDRRMS
jgi:hypothetical protein